MVVDYLCYFGVVVDGEEGRGGVEALDYSETI